MKTLTMRLVTIEGDELECVPVEEFAIAEAWQETEEADGESITKRVDALYHSLLTLLRERQAAPRQGTMWLKLALGKAILTADESPEDIVLKVMVEPLRNEEEEENDEHDDLPY